MYVSTGRSNYPFRVIESDVASIHSISSLGIVGRIMAGGSIDTFAHSAGSSSVKQVAVPGKQQPPSKKGTGGTGGQIPAGVYWKGQQETIHFHCNTFLRSYCMPQVAFGLRVGFRESFVETHSYESSVMSDSNLQWNL
uniref:Uncharacterized protein n=1 Tax=Anopheles melas TaxID=34690 RepID=A0A182UCU5_9DIPT